MTRALVASAVAPAPAAAAAGRSCYATLFDQSLASLYHHLRQRFRVRRLGNLRVEI